MSTVEFVRCNGMSFTNNKNSAWPKTLSCLEATPQYTSAACSSDATNRLICTSNAARENTERLWTHSLRQLIQASGIAFVLYYQQNQPVLLSERGSCSVVFNYAKYPNINFKLSAIVSCRDWILVYFLQFSPLRRFFFRLDVWRVKSLWTSSL